MGYTETFRDDFAQLNQTVWTDHAFWDGEPAAGTVHITGGVLNVESRRTGGYPFTSVTSGPEWHQGTVKKDWLYGYFEARMRFTGGKGSWPAFWLASSAWSRNPWSGSGPQCPLLDNNYELDIFEGQGDEPQTFYGTQHNNTGGWCGIPDTRNSGIGNVANLYGNFHRIGVLWTAAGVSWWIDDTQVGVTRPLLSGGDQRLYLILGMEVCGWDASNQCDASTADIRRSEFDWVRVWQK